MIDKYYYLIASLPYLNIEQKPLISDEYFLQECQNWLTDKDKSIILDATIDSLQIKEGDPEALREWKVFDINLRKKLSDIRILKKQNLNIHDKLHGAIKEIFEQQTPLLMEKRLCRIRWDFLEDTAYKYNFDINALIVYFLKLQIIKRLFVFDKEKGKQAFKGLTKVSVQYG